MLVQEVPGQFCQLFIIGERFQVFNRVDTSGDGTPDAWDSGQADYFGTDGHGSIRVLYDLAAAIVQDVQNNLPQIYHFDAYGNLLNFDTAT
ncbi:MAG: hypothetical protein AAF623_10280, partial [Planctomycetota bacterium]